MTSETRATIRRYFALMTASDVDGIIALFTEDAVISSPFLGDMPAPAFFRKLGQASAASQLTVFDVLLGETGQTAAAHFQYDWTLKSGEVLTFQGIDHFRIAPDGRFAGMSIFYDTHPLRADVGDKYASA